MDTLCNYALLLRDCLHNQPKVCLLAGCPVQVHCGQGGRIAAVLWSENNVAGGASRRGVRIAMQDTDKRGPWQARELILKAKQLASTDKLLSLYAQNF